MTPQTTGSPADLNITGYRIQALLKAEEGMILTLKRPPDIADIAQPRTDDAPLHVAFFPALVVNLPPGVQPTPQVMQETAKHPSVGLMVRTHEGPLPEMIQAICEPLMPAEQFATIQGRAITGVQTPPDGTHGLIIEIKPDYLLQIDLTGAIIYQTAPPRPN